MRTCVVCMCEFDFVSLLIVVGVVVIVLDLFVGCICLFDVDENCGK